MIKPKKCWMLYLNKVENLKEYDLCIGRELSRSDTHAKLEIYETFGHRNGLPDNKIVDIPLEHLKLGCQTKEHSEYYRYCIKEINTKYLQSERDIWYINAVFGYDASLKVINERSGILNDETLEEIARQNKAIYKVLETKRGAILAFDNFHDRFKVLEEISALDALKSYGIKILEEVHEKTCAGIEKGVTTKRLREEKINSIL